MSPKHPTLALAALSVLTACGRSGGARTAAVRSTLMEDCFPPAFQQVEALLDVANSLRLNSDAVIADPPGLEAREDGHGGIVVSYRPPDAEMSLDGTINFFGDRGNRESPNAGGGSLNERIREAAPQLLDGNRSPFLVLAWTLSGDGLEGEGALTGFFGFDRLNHRSLVALDTTQDGSQALGGPPPAASGEVKISSAKLECALTFEFSGLELDGDRDQIYPIGEMRAELIAPSDAAVLKITFDGSHLVSVAVDGDPELFEYDLDDGQLRRIP